MKSSLKTALIAAVVSAVVAAGAAVATTQTFVLGSTNRVDAPTKVTNLQSNGTTVNPVDAPLVMLENKSTTANATPLSLLAAPNHSPFKVNSTTKVANLNADQLDGRDSAYFLPKTAKAADADKLDGLDSTALVRGRGNTSGSAAQIARATDGSTRTFTPSPAVVPGLANITIDCPPSGAGAALIRAYNLTGNPMHVFARNGVIQATDYVVLDASDPMQGWGTASFADITHLTIWGATEAQPGVLTQATVSTSVTGSLCTFFIQALSTNTY